MSTILEQILKSNIRNVLFLSITPHSEIAHLYDHVMASSLERSSSKKKDQNF